MLKQVGNIILGKKKSTLFPNGICETSLLVSQKSSFFFKYSSISEEIIGYQCSVCVSIWLNWNNKSDFPNQYGFNFKETQTCQ